MSDLLLALDQGTTSSKALLVDGRARVVASSSVPLAIASPRPGWVEQDADALYSSVLEALAKTLAREPDAHIAGVAVSNQRETVVAWDAATGRPLGPALSWQDARGEAACAALDTPAHRALVRERTGLELSAMYSAPKIAWLLNAIGRLSGVRVGTVDAWLVDRLTGGTTYAIEAGNASRTLLLNLQTLDWDADLCALFGIDPGVLPPVRPSTGPWGATRGVPGLPDGVPIAAVLGDSHAALFGHGVLAGDQAPAKATFGTGSSVMAPASGADARRDGVSTTLAWLTDAPRYAHEANILYAGAGIDWLAGTLGLASGPELSALAATVPDSGGATFVPALNGLAAPWWEPTAVGTLTGLSVRTTRAHLARAGLDAVAHQVCDILDVMDADGALPLLHAGGGATASGLLMQTQADLLGRPLLVSSVADISALGAAALAASALGLDFTPDADLAGTLVRPSPDYSPADRAADRARWSDALARAGVRTTQGDQQPSATEPPPDGVPA